MAHAPAAKQRRQHDTLVAGQVAHLHFHFDEGLLLALELAAARDVLHLLVVGVGDSVQLVGGLLLRVVQRLHGVYYLAQLHRQLLLAEREFVELQDLLLILRVDAFLVRADLAKLIVQRLSRALENLPHVIINIGLDVSAHFFD